VVIKSLDNCREFIAADNSLLRELLHPDKGDFKIHYSLAQATVNPGQTTKPHKLKVSEVYYILEGSAIMHVNDEAQGVAPGCAVYIPPESIQYIENKGSSDLKFLCLVDPAWRPEDEQIIKGG